MWKINLVCLITAEGTPEYHFQTIKDIGTTFEY